MAKDIPWYEGMQEPKYIEVPLVKYAGGSDKILWPYFAIALSLGTFITALFVW